MNSSRVLPTGLAGFVVVSLCAAAIASPPVKVICASRAEKPPVIDGVLDDACWAKTEVRGDFVTPTTAKPVKLRTTMRFVYDDKNLYAGLEFYWDDIEALRKGIRSILGKHRIVAGRTPLKEYDNRYGVEMFFDPNSSRLNSYQILFNAAGQFAGNYNMIEEQFEKIQTVKTTVQADRWTAELVYPVRGKPLAVGDVWGLNVVRNNETYYGMWTYIHGAFLQPKRFGRLIIGDYASWWDAVFARGAMARLADIRQNMEGSKHLQALYGLTWEKAARLDRLSKKHRPSNRENFEILYVAYRQFKKNMDRLEAAYQTHRQMEAN